MNEELKSAATERNLLSCVIRSQEAWLAVSDRVRGEDFSSPLNRALWTIIDSLYTSNAKVDPVTISDKLPDDLRKELKEMGEWNYLGSLSEIPIDSGNAELHAKDLRELAKRRNFMHLGDEVQQWVLAGKTSGEISENLEKRLVDIDGEIASEVTLIGEGSEQYVMERMENPAEIPGLPSGFTELDKSILGFEPGELYVVGARKKIGKSILLMNWAKYLAVDKHVPILWITTEHNHAKDRSRIMSLISGVWERRIRNGTFTAFPDDVTNVNRAVKALESGEIKFYFVNLIDFSATKIRKLARKYVRVHNCGAVFFDYIKTPEQQVYGSKEYQELGAFAFALKAIATEENVPVVSATQLSRRALEQFAADGEMDSDAFGGSDRISHALSVAMILRELNTKEKEKYGFGDDDTTGRILAVTDARSGRDNYKALINFDCDVIKMEERTLI